MGIKTEVYLFANGNETVVVGLKGEKNEKTSRSLLNRSKLAVMTASTRQLYKVIKDVHIAQHASYVSVPDA